MSIRKQIIWDDSKGKFVGYVDYGGFVDNDFETAASEALFLQIVSYTNKLKCPVAYFLTNKTSASMQTQILTSCLRKLFEVGLVVRSITCDGASTNIQTIKNLIGSDFNGNVTYFYHPCASDVKVYCMLDTCHMLKLARNCMAEKKLTSETGYIGWEFIKRLHDVQEREQLHFANSLSSAHMNYRNKVMNVRLAAQTLSSTVANALAYLQSNGDPNFKGCDDTVNFIRIADKIFDMLNARYPFSKGYKSPIRPNTLAYCQQVFRGAVDYFKSLQIDGVPILTHPRKSFAVGFICTMNSMLGLAQDLLRQLLFRNSIQGSVSGNCMDFNGECTQTFEFRAEHRSSIQLNETKEEEIFDFSVLDRINENTLSEYQENVLYYLAGFLVKKLLKITLCSDCVNILLHRNESKQTDHIYSAPRDPFKQFTCFSSNGGLLFAADIVYKVVEFTEKHYRTMVKRELIKTNNIKVLLRNAAVQKFSLNLEAFQPAHPVSEEFIVEDIHEIQLIKGIVNQFLKCRMPHHAKLVNENTQKDKLGMRQKLTKLILFNNQ